MRHGQLHGRGYTCPNPACRKTLDGFSSVGHDNAPSPGDITVCAYCQAALVFLENGLRLMTADEFDALPAEDREGLLRVGIALHLFETTKRPPGQA